MSVSFPQDYKNDTRFLRIGILDNKKMRERRTPGSAAGGLGNTDFSVPLLPLAASHIAHPLANALWRDAGSGCIHLPTLWRFPSAHTPAPLTQAISLHGRLPVAPSGKTEAGRFRLPASCKRIKDPAYTPHRGRFLPARTKRSYPPLMPCPPQTARCPARLSQADRAGSVSDARSRENKDDHGICGIRGWQA